LKSFHYGFDLENLYFRFDLNVPLNDKDLQGLVFRINFFLPPDREVSFSLNPDGGIKDYQVKTPFGQKTLDSAAAGKIIELKLPLSDLQIEPEFLLLEFTIQVLKNGSELEKWPAHASITIPKPTHEFLLRNWSV
jgi:hypothetical protein